MDAFCYLYFVYVLLSCLFIATLWSPAWKRDNLSTLLHMICVFVTFPCGVLGQLWYLIVSIPELLTYFQKELIFW